VTAQGLVQAGEPGSAIISAISGRAQGSAEVTVIAPVQSISAGGLHTCGVMAAGAAYCWGWGGLGQLGNGSTTFHDTPVAVSGGLTFASIAAGRTFTCGVTTSGAAYCWGVGGNGQLGNGSTAGQTTPVAVST